MDVYYLFAKHKECAGYSFFFWLNVLVIHFCPLMLVMQVSQAVCVVTSCGTEPVNHSISQALHS